MDQVRSILQQCGRSVLYGVIALSIGFVLFTLMERLFSVRRMKKPWRATFLDLQYALLSMLYPPFIYFILSKRGRFSLLTFFLNFCYDLSRAEASRLKI